jgi:hypothetical protein
MGVLETVSRIVELGGRPERAPRVAEMRATFEARAGAFTPDDPWFEARSRAFWCDAVTRGRFGREVEGELDEASRRWLPPLERAHRGLFRAEGRRLVDVWSGVELLLDEVDEESRAELDAAAGQVFDARVAAGASPLSIALLPGAIFHPPDATAPIGAVLDAARARDLSTDAALDALLRMEQRLRSLSRVKAAYAYRVEALDAPASPASPLRRAAKASAR